MRIINGHSVYGKEVTVFANSEAEAKQLAVRGKGSDWFAWEAKQIHPAGVYTSSNYEMELPAEWEVYICLHQNAFALND
jgi:hypothetical protein